MTEEDQEAVTIQDGASPAKTPIARRVNADTAAYQQRLSASGGGATTSNSPSTRPTSDSQRPTVGFAVAGSSSDYFVPMDNNLDSVLPPSKTPPIPSSGAGAGTDAGAGTGGVTVGGTASIAGRMAAHVTDDGPKHVRDAVPPTPAKARPGTTSSTATSFSPASSSILKPLLRMGGPIPAAAITVGPQRQAARNATEAPSARSTVAVDGTASGGGGRVRAGPTPSLVRAPGHHPSSLPMDVSDPPYARSTVAVGGTAFYGGVRAGTTSTLARAPGYRRSSLPAAAEHPYYLANTTTTTAAAAAATAHATSRHHSTGGGQRGHPTASQRHATTRLATAATTALKSIVVDGGGYTYPHEYLHRRHHRASSSSDYVLRQNSSTPAPTSTVSPTTRIGRPHAPPSRPRTTVGGSRWYQDVRLEQHTQGRSRLAPATRTAGGRWGSNHGRLEALIPADESFTTPPPPSSTTIVADRVNREEIGHPQWVLSADSNPGLAGW